jgi:hypothetical protein
MLAIILAIAAPVSASKRAFAREADGLGTAVALMPLGADAAARVTPGEITATAAIETSSSRHKPLDRWECACE